MRKKVLLLRNLSSPIGDDVAAAPRFFSRAARGRVDLYETSFENLVIKVGDGGFSIFDTKNKKDLKEFRIVIIRGTVNFDAVCDVALAVGYYGRKHRIRVMNDVEYDTLSKLAQAVRFQALNIPVAKSIWLSEAVLRNEEICSSLGFPCIMKATLSSLGKFNYKVNSYKEILKRQKENPGKHFVLQRMVGGMGDYRLLMVGKEKLLISYPVNNHKTYEQSATNGDGAEVVPLSVLPSRAIKDAEKIAKYMRMSIGGVDILTDKNTGEYHFLEINAQPNLSNLDDPVKAKIATFGEFFATA